MRHIKGQWIVKGIVFGTVMLLVFTGFTMLLWNNLAVSIFGLPALTFVQTLGLMVLGRLLTGGFGRGWGGGGLRGRMRGRYMRERWQNMSEEERRRFMQRWGKHWGGAGAPEEETQNPTA